MRNSEKLVNLKLVALVGTCFLLQLSHDGMLGVNLHGAPQVQKPGPCL